MRVAPRRKSLISAADIHQIAAMFPQYSAKHIGNCCRDALRRCPLNRNELVAALAVSALFAPGKKPNFTRRCEIVSSFFAGQPDMMELAPFFNGSGKRKARRRPTLSSE